MKLTANRTLAVVIGAGVFLLGAFGFIDCPCDACLDALSSGNLDCATITNCGSCGACGYCDAILDVLPCANCDWCTPTRSRHRSTDTGAPDELPRLVRSNAFWCDYANFILAKGDCAGLDDAVGLL